MFSEMQHMQQNDQKMIPKSTERLPKSTQDAQDAAKMASWSPHGRQNASQDGPKTPKKVMFFFFFSCFWCQMLPSAPQDARDSEIWSKKSPQDLPRPPLDLDFITIFDDFDDILKEFSSCFAFLFFLCLELLCFAEGTCGY